MREFPDRETWEARERTVYFDMMDSFQSDKIGDYATEEEITSITEALEARWKAMRRDVTAAKREAGDLLAQDYWDLSEDGQALVSDYCNAREERKRIRKDIKELGYGCFPKFSMTGRELIEEIEARRAKACQEAVKRYENRELTDADYERARERYYQPVGIIRMGHPSTH